MFTQNNNNQLFSLRLLNLFNPELNKKFLASLYYSTSAPKNSSSATPMLLPAPFSDFPAYHSFPLADLKTMRKLLKGTWGIYCIILINPADGIPRFYIGSSAYLFRRLTQHVNPRNWTRTSKLYNSLRKHGINSFQVLILFQLDYKLPVDFLRVILLFLEQLFMDIFNPNLNILIKAVLL